MLYIEHDIAGACFRLIEDEIGLCTSKSRNVLVRIRDALNATAQTGLVGLTVEEDVDRKRLQAPDVSRSRLRGVVLAFDSNHLVVRLPDGKLDLWHVQDCQIVEPVQPTRDTPGNEPSIGIRTACELLVRWLEEDPAQIEAVTKQFLADRSAAEPSP